KRSPMNRGTGFRKPELPPRVRPALVPRSEPARATLRIDTTARMSVPLPKREYVRDAGLRAAYRQIPCPWEGCGIQDRTVCCAHSDWSAHGKGKGIKADDSRGAALCFVHHQMLDQGKDMSAAERREGWMFAHKRSVRLLIQRGLWPKDVP